MSNTMRAVVLGLSTLIPAYHRETLTQEVSKPQVVASATENQDEKKEALRKIAVENRYSFAIAAFVRDPNNYVVDKKDLEIAMGEPDTYFALGIGQNPTTIDLLKDKEIHKTLKDFILNKINNNLSIGLSQNNFPIDADIQNLCRKKLTIIAGAEYYFAQKSEWKVTEEDRKIARANYRTSFATGIVQNESYVPAGQLVPEVDQEVARKDPFSWFAKIISEKDGFIPGEKDIKAAMSEEEIDGKSAIQTDYSWNVAKKVRVKDEHIKLAMKHLDSMWADGIAANYTLEDVKEEYRKVARENPESMYAEALVDNLNFVPNENDKKFAKENPETLYSKCIEKWFKVNITADQFDKEVLKSDIPVLVDFWATWCGPCRRVSPLVEEVGEEYEGKLKIIKINVDSYPDLANKYDVERIPALIFFNKGNIAHRIVGAVPKETIASEVNKILDGNKTP